MKKLLAILLVLTMVLPMCLVTNAAGTNVEKKPFMITNSEDLGTDFDNFWPKIMLWSRASDEYVSENHLKIDIDGLVTESPVEAAERLKVAFEGYPDGMRFIRLFAMRPALVHLLDDTIFMERGVKMFKAWMDEFLNHYKSIGGKLDGVVGDLEYFDGFVWKINQTADKDPLVYYKIVENENYATKIRPELEAHGFKFWPNPNEDTPEIFSIDNGAGEEYAQSKKIWDVVVRNHFNRYLDECVFDTLQNLYPDAIYTDYQARQSYAWDKVEVELGASHMYKGGNHVTVGNVNYLNTYAARPSNDFFANNSVPVYNNIPSFNGVAYPNNAFNMVLFDTHFAKILKASAPNEKITITLAWHNYSSRATSYCNSPYFTEVTYHMGMLDPTPFQSYVIEDEILARGSDVEEAVQVLSEQLNELTRVAGYADRKNIAIPYTWSDKYLLTGMYAGGRNIWRITPDLFDGSVTLESFKVEGAKDPTFSIAGQTITFPGGKIVEDSKISVVGSCGYWVETAKDVLPVITMAEDRYEQYPAFLQNFESQDLNADFDFNLAEPLACWEVKKNKDATAKIAELDGSKALALTGNYNLRLKTVLKNVTAGDTYAKNQAWEILVDVPADLAAEAEVVALSIYDNKSKVIDGGFKIAGGKLYYDNAGKYVEWTGVDVSAGGKFRLVRKVDFTNAEAFTCDYLIYDGENKLLAQVKDVPMVTMELPVQKLSFGVSQVSGNAVKFDNYKLYANGLAADFELYDAEHGRKFSAEEMEKPYAKNTAYRLSWLNGTAYEKAYSIVAAFYEGDKLVEEKVIQEIKMAPGTDHVETGIVEVKAGQSVKIYARNDSQPEPEDNKKPVDNKPGASKPKNNDTVMVIAIIAFGVIFFGSIIVGALILTKKPVKKTPKKAPKKSEE